jgi:peptidoglycan/LPS O-acetylase OafA/YrhL
MSAAGVTALPAPPTRSPARGHTAMRPEIQALRAIAAVAVVLYHLWPARLPGGFVGVDVFFAISGFLIIGHLLRQVDATGRFSLVEFWSRRARRLIPAALLVLLISAAATIALAPTVVWRRFLEEIAAAAVYAENWLLAASSVDYLASDNAPSPAQHYWSLSIEEQFYIAWPLILILVLACTARRSPLARRRMIGCILAGLTVASLVYSIMQVGSGTPIAYFDTFGRAWEFGVGGLLAFAARASERAAPGVRAFASWAGLTLIVVTVFAYGAATPFPGASALIPVIGALLVIFAGTPAVRWAPATLLAAGPMQWLGDRSYSIYLWHWPLLVLLPYALGAPLDTWARVGVLLATIVLAALTFRFVEEPVRRGRVLRLRRPRSSVLLAVSASVTVVLLCVGTVAVSSTAARATGQAHVVEGCVGAAAVTGDASCADPHLPSQLADPVAAATDYGRGVASDDPCKTLFESAEVVTCTFGASADQAEQRIAVVGDSHAAHLVEALDANGKARDVAYVTYLKTLCTGTGAEGVAPADKAIDYGISSCTEWGRSVLDAIAGDPGIDAVLFTNFTRQYAARADNGVGRPIEPADFVSAWDRLRAAGKPVAAIRDVPQATIDEVPACVAAQLNADDPCTFARIDGVLEPDPMLTAAAQAGAGVVDLSDVFCDDERCHSVIGGLIVYVDSHHLTSAFSTTLGPVLGTRIETALAGAR